MAEHVLKCWPDYFQAIADGRKTFEVRYDDRGFQAGDTVVLREYDEQSSHRLGNINDEWRYSGREIHAEIGYVLHAIPQVKQWQPGHNLDGYVVFSLVKPTLLAEKPTTAKRKNAQRET